MTSGNGAGVMLDGGPLSIEQVVRVARTGATVSIDPGAVRKVNSARMVVDRAVSEGRTVYGVTTGFGALANIRIPDEELDLLQRSLLRSHAAGVGPPLDLETTRAMMLLRAGTLASGLSGVRAELIERLIQMLNAGVHPVIPEQGSVGASGDLAQLAHMALPLIGEGEVRIRGEVYPAAVGLAAVGLEPIDLSHKEGLSLLNGTEAMLAVGCLATADAMTLARTADVVCAMSIDALLGTDKPFDERLHRIRPHPGQLVSAANLRGLLQDSAIIASHRDSDHAVQDAYSLRCTPQVHGAVRDVVDFAASVFGRELASVTDNPVVLADSGEVLSTGNFHGEPLGFALDFLAQGLSELGSISERRTDRMLDPERSSGMPAFLADRPGTNSGFMLTQYTQAALVSENRILSHPATVDTIPTSGSQEDHVSMGWNAALKLRRVVVNVAYILAVEAMCAAQAIDARAPLESGRGTRVAHRAVREIVPHLDEDRALGPEIQKVADGLIRSGVLIGRVESEIGEVR